MLSLQVGAGGGGSERQEGTKPRHDFCTWSSCSADVQMETDLRLALGMREGSSFFFKGLSSYIVSSLDSMQRMPGASQRVAMVTQEAYGRVPARLGTCLYACLMLHERLLGRATARE